MKIYGGKPVEIASDVIIDNSEMYFYQYLPIKLKNQDNDYVLPERLERIEDLLIKCCNDFFDYFCKGDYKIYNEHYIYLTSKCLYVTSGENLNRAGWHCDGFMTDDVNYIWSDCIPTEYVTGQFELIQDHEKSLEQMNRLFYHSEPLKCKPNSIYRLDETVIHRCGYNHSKDAVLRHFVKISFSKEKYNLKGNSHNYLLDYKWEMKERDLVRNHPTK